MDLILNTKRESVNLFNDKNIQCYKIVFNIINEEDLLQWWEYNIEQSIEKYQDSVEFVHTLYRFCFYLIERNQLSFDIIFEKSQENRYWTIWSKTELPKLQMKCIEFENIKCIRANDRVSFKMNFQTEDKKTSCPILSKPLIQKKLTIYDFLENNDKLIITELNEELSEELIYLEGKGFSQKSIDKIQKLLSEYSLILSSYSELYYIKNSIEELSHFINQNHSILIDLDSSYIALFEGLITNLHNWYEAMFITGASSIEAFKDSISADVQIIKMMTLQSKESREVEFF